MKSFKKAIRLVCLVLLIFLASVGVGLSGGAAVPVSRKKESPAEVNTELVEPRKEKMPTAAEAYKT